MTNNDVLELLRSHELVTDALLQEGKNGVQFIVIPIDFQSQDFEDLRKLLRKYLSAYLPHSQIPQDFLFLEKKPFLSDQKKENHSPNFSLSNVSDLKKAEEDLVKIFKEVLEIKKIDEKKSFIAMGGDSLKAMQIIARIDEIFDISMSFHDVFQFSTLLELKQNIIRKISGIIGKIEW